jgi:alkanesulfonate monooxygenase SsuD/methylene tetrahydromethanopterin reductase-like flavin-dependent oxidoreductase (luciferase family)
MLTPGVDVAVGVDGRTSRADRSRFGNVWILCVEGDPRPEVTMEFDLFLPQMRVSFPDLVGRARAAEAAGFAGMSGMDHLAPPMAEEQPMYEALVTTAWLAAHTERLALGSLVLCDAFRHPALLARQAVSIDHASGGRFELGVGWGSVPEELATFGVGSTEPGARVSRLRESLEIIRALWAGETVDHTGEHFRLEGARQEPRPLGHIPIVIGGVGPKTLALVRDFGDWWNLHIGHLHRIDELRPQVGDARVSIQQMVALVPRGGDRERVTEVAERRFGYARPQIGTGPELLDHYGRLERRGIERVYTWFCDFAPPETLAEFGETVVAPLTDGNATLR